MKVDRVIADDERFAIATGESRVIMPGLTVHGNRNGFVAVDLGMEADPQTFTPELIESEKAGMPGWRWKQEMLRDWDAQTGQPVFEEEWIDRQRARAREPVEYMDIHRLSKNGVVQRDSLGHVKYVLVPKSRRRGRLKVYIRPETRPAGLPEHVTEFSREAGIGIDVGEGVEKSDSTIQVFFNDTREQAACLACNTIRPGMLGRFAVEVGRFFNNALICCVRKMHGITTIRAMADRGYPMIWRDTDPKTVVEKRTANLGWKRGEITDDLLIGRWIDAMEADLVKLYDIETINQHRAYIYDELGRPCHQRLKSQPVAVREKHGDLVIAGALAWRACLDLPKFKIRTPMAPPHNSPADRRKRYEARRNKTGERW